MFGKLCVNLSEPRFIMRVFSLTLFPKLYIVLLFSTWLQLGKVTWGEKADGALKRNLQTSVYEAK